MLNIKIDIERMKLREQEEFETLTGDSLSNAIKKGMTGRRLAALVYIFAKREDPSVTFEQCLDLDMGNVAEMMDTDPKAEN